MLWLFAAWIELSVKLVVGTLATTLVFCEYGSVVELRAVEIPVGEIDCSTGLACANNRLWIMMAQAANKRERHCSIILTLFEVLLGWSP